MLDAKLLSRVEKIMEEDRTNMPPESVTEQLRADYPEYARKKFRPFCKVVQEAISVVEKNTGQHSGKTTKKRKSCDESSESSFSEDNPDYVTQEDPGCMNKLVSSMYQEKKRKLTPATQSANMGKKFFFTDKTGTQENLQTFSTPSKPNPSTIFNEKESLSAQKGDSSLQRSSSKSGLHVSASMNDLEKLQLIKKKNTKSKSAPTEKPAATDVEVSYSTSNFDDIGGHVALLRKLIGHFKFYAKPKRCKRLKCVSPRGFLIHGPPGSGKTQLAWAMAGELQVPILALSANQVVSGISGESERKIRDIFDSAMANAPCVLFIDKMDAIAKDRQNSKAMDERIINQLASCMDELRQKAELMVLVVGATQFPDSLDSSLRCPGKFEKEIYLPPPDDTARKCILQKLCRHLPNYDQIDYDRIAYLTPGFVGGDLLELQHYATKMSLESIVDGEIEDFYETQEKEEEDGAGDAKLLNKQAHSMNTGLEDLKKVRQYYQSHPAEVDSEDDSFAVTTEDFIKNIENVVPAAKKKGFATVPDVTWEDVGALLSVKEQLRKLILRRIKRSQLYQKNGMSKAKGVLLVGPPGCGKTLLAKAAANEGGLNFISVRGPELYSKYQGESESNVRQVFERARSAAPCIIFFDEVDSLGSKRSSGDESGSRRDVVTQLLTMMDGFGSRKQVYVMAATNCLNLVDPALLRPGRFDKVVYVGLPTKEDRADILKAITKNGTCPQLALEVDLKEIAAHPKCESYSGADLQLLVSTAFDEAVEEMEEKESSSSGEAQDDDVLICKDHFLKALDKLKPSVTKEVLHQFKAIEKKLSND